MQQFNQHVQNSLNSKEVLELLATVTNVPKDDFLNILAYSVLEQSSAVPLIQEEKSKNAIEKKQLLLERLNYRNGIHYTVTYKT